MATSGAKPRSGKGGRIQINGTTVKLKEWRIDPKGEDHDTTNFECGGYAEGIIGVEETDIFIKGEWDAGQNPQDNPPNIKRAAVLTNVKLFVNVTDNTFFLFPSVRVVNTPINCEVRGVVMIEANMKTNGTWTDATGSV